MRHDRTGNPIQPDGMDMTVTENIGQSFYLRPIEGENMVMLTTKDGYPVIGETGPS